MTRGQKRRNWVTRKYSDFISNLELRHRLLTSPFTSHRPPTSQYVATPRKGAGSQLSLTLPPLPAATTAAQLRLLLVTVTVLPCHQVGFNLSSPVPGHQRAARLAPFPRETEGSNTFLGSMAQPAVKPLFLQLAGDKQNKILHLKSL